MYQFIKEPQFPYKKNILQLGRLEKVHINKVTSKSVEGQVNTSHLCQRPRIKKKSQLDTTSQSVLKFSISSENSLSYLNKTESNTKKTSDLERYIEEQIKKKQKLKYYDHPRGLNQLRISSFKKILEQQENQNFQIKMEVFQKEMLDGVKTKIIKNLSGRKFLLSPSSERNFYNIQPKRKILNENYLNNINNEPSDLYQIHNIPKKTLTKKQFFIKDEISIKHMKLGQKPTKYFGNSQIFQEDLINTDVSDSFAQRPIINCQEMELFQNYIQAGDNYEVEYLLRKNPYLIKYKDDSGRTPLHYAIIYNNPKITRQLISLNADLYTRDYSKFQCSPLDLLDDPRKIQLKESVQDLLDDF